MAWNPFVNALAAAAYIWSIGLFFNYMNSINHDTPDTFTAPIVMLSLLVFSVATMAFLFFYRPLVLLMENKKHEAIGFFVKTLAAFGVLTLLAIATVL